MATYTIQILNESGFPKSYVVFSQPPEVTSSGGSTQVFTNAWVTFSSTKPGGFDKVSYDDVTDAYWGTTPSAIGTGVIVSTGGFVTANTEHQDSVTFTATEPRGFGPVTHGKASTGAFQIVAQSDFTAKDKIVFGMAKPTNTPIAEPVATFAAEPNDTFDVIPVVKFYVADGAFTTGQIIDVKKFSTKSGEIDFTGRSQTTATVTQKADGSFTLEYS